MEYFIIIRIKMFSSSVCFMTRNIFSLIFEILEIEQGIKYGGGKIRLR